MRKSARLSAILLFFFFSLLLFSCRDRLAEVNAYYSKKVGDLALIQKSHPAYAPAIENFLQQKKSAWNLALSQTDDSDRLEQLRQVVDSFEQLKSGSELLVAEILELTKNLRSIDETIDRILQLRYQPKVVEEVEKVIRQARGLQRDYRNLLNKIQEPGKPLSAELKNQLANSNQLLGEMLQRLLDYQKKGRN